MRGSSFGELRRSAPASSERADGAVAAPEAEQDAPGVELGEWHARSPVTVGWRVSGFATATPSAIRSVAASPSVM